MRYINRKGNILINIVLCLCAFMLAVSFAEYTLRKMDIEGLSGNKIFLGMSGFNYSLSLWPYMVKDGKILEFTLGNCYPSDAAGYFPVKAVNPFDGKALHCVLYDIAQRRQGFNPERKRQIALVGDSFTFGEGVKEEDTLGYLLNEQYPEVNFQNRGKRGAMIYDVTRLCKEVIESRPAVEEVIYFYNLNDVRMSQQVSVMQRDIITDMQNIRWEKDNEGQPPSIPFLARSALFLTARKVWIINRESSRTIQNYRDMYLSDNNRQEFLSTMDDIKFIKDMLAGHGISFRMVIYPLIYKDILGRYPFAQIHEVIMNECRKRNVTCLDGYQPFKDHYSMKKFAVHPLDYHPNGLSNKLLVDYLRERDFIEVKKDPQSH
jgi:hypothetical protein